MHISFVCTSSEKLERENEQTGHLTYLHISLGPGRLTSP